MAVPDYLKSLDTLLAGGSAAAVAPGFGGAVAQPQPQGFGQMFAPPSTDKLRFMLISTHAHQVTGYSKVSYGILQELAKDPSLQVTHFGFQKFHTVPPNFRPYPPSIRVIDAAALEKPATNGFGYNILPEAIRRVKPAVIMIYNDLAVVSQFMEAIRKSGIPRNFKVWVYCDQVYTMQMQAYIDLLNRDADRVFAFNKEWKACLKDQGVTRPIDLLLHGFNKEHVFPVPKELARKAISLPNDMFLFLNVNRNQPRKRYDLLIMAFVELLVKYPTKPLYLLCICDRGEKGGWWLFELFARELKLRGVALEPFSQRLIVTAQNMTFRDEDINMFYNAADVGITTADGEGWGLCQFEQMGLGIPQVVPAIGAFKEFCGVDNSVLVNPTVRYYLPTAFSPVGGEAHACTPHDICVGMERYVLDSELRKTHGEAAAATIAAYTWEKGCATLLRRLQAEKEEE